MASSRLAALAQQSKRQDGYTNDSPVFAFQAWAEAQASCDYNKLRSVLAQARNQSVTFEQLVSLYNA